MHASKSYFSNTAMLVTNKQCHFDMFRMKFDMFHMKFIEDQQMHFRFMMYYIVTTNMHRPLMRPSSGS
jgi:hypothetical protein